MLGKMRLECSQATDKGDSVIDSLWKLMEKFSWLDKLAVITEEASVSSANNSYSVVNTALFIEESDLVDSNIYSQTRE